MAIDSVFLLSMGMTEKIVYSEEFKWTLKSLGMERQPSGNEHVLSFQKAKFSSQHLIVLLTSLVSSALGDMVPSPGLHGYLHSQVCTYTQAYTHI